MKRKIKKNKMNVDDYIKFLDMFNEFINHKKKKKVKITGKNWKL